MAVITAAPKAAAPAPKLKLVTSRGRVEYPLMITLYSPEGLGKSTWASKAPRPIILDIEHGTRELDVDRFVFDEATSRTTPESFAEVLAALRALESEEHPYKTVVLDTADALEHLIHAHICYRDGKQGIEDYGFGKGYVAALDEWRLLVALLERLRKRGMNVIVLAHSSVRPFKDPASDGWDRYQMKLHHSAAGLIKERSDVVLFGAYETFAIKNEKTKRVQGVSTGARIVHTVHNAAWDAKNRHDLPEQMPLDWDDFYAAVQAHRPADPKALVAEIVRKAKEVGGEVEEKSLAFVAEHENDAAALAKLNDRLNAKLAAREQGGN
jgi:hypothetical protein